MKITHTPVLTEEVRELLALEKGLIVDATLGEGGHAEMLLEHLPKVRLVGVEVDQDIATVAVQRLQRFGDRFRLWRGWFSDFFTNYGSTGEGRPDRVLFDLGISTFHYQSRRGFSFAEDGPLDMRLNLSEGPSAADLIQGLTEIEMADLFFRYGEERLSRRIARRVVETRRSRRIETAADLADLIRGAVPPKYRHARIHPATRCFQALRIAVNHELDRLSEALPASLGILAPNGRIGVIAFHSLEDRIVKRFFRTQADLGAVHVLTKKPLRPSPEEVQINAASRSARFRVAELCRVD